MVNVTQSDLTPNEKQVLIVLEKLKTTDPQKLSSASNLHVKAVMQSAFMLQECRA